MTLDRKAFLDDFDRLLDWQIAHAIFHAVERSERAALSQQREALVQALFACRNFSELGTLTRSSLLSIRVGVQRSTFSSASTAQLALFAFRECVLVGDWRRAERLLVRTYANRVDADANDEQSAGLAFYENVWRLAFHVLLRKYVSAVERRQRRHAEQQQVVELQSGGKRRQTTVGADLTRELLAAVHAKFEKKCDELLTYFCPIIRLRRLLPNAFDVLLVLVASEQFHAARNFLRMIWRQFRSTSTQQELQLLRQGYEGLCDYCDYFETWNREQRAIELQADAASDIAYDYDGHNDLLASSQRDRAEGLAANAVAGLSAASIGLRRLASSDGKSCEHFLVLACKLLVHQRKRDEIASLLQEYRAACSPTSVCNTTAAAIVGVLADEFGVSPTGEDDTVDVSLLRELSMSLPSHLRVLELASELWESAATSMDGAECAFLLRTLAEFVYYAEHRHSTRAWRLLRRVLRRATSACPEEVRTFWTMNEFYWNRYHCGSTNGTTRCVGDDPSTADELAKLQESVRRLFARVF